MEYLEFKKETRPKTGKSLEALLPIKMRSNKGLTP